MKPVVRGIKEMKITRQRVLWTTAGILWAVGVCVGMRTMLDYENTPGTPASALTEWPSDSHVPRTKGIPAIVVIAHPQCPCTRATIGELALIMTRLHGQVTATVIFAKPEGAPDGWEETDLWRSALAIPGVSVMSDPGMVETDRFHASASGQTMLYSANGQLLFRGGITISRGHSGDNTGRSAIVSLVTTGKAERTRTSVYGCALHNANSAEQRKNL
jgi:hypothetical protein